MDIAPIALLAGAGLFLLGSLLRAPVMVALFGSMALGSTAIATLPAVGGAVVLLYVPLAGLFIASVMLRRSFLNDLARVFTLHWAPAVIAMLLVYAVVSALIFPRLFAGQTTVFVPVQGAVVETGLMPVSGNLNQVGYFCIGILSFFAMAALLLRQQGFRVLKVAFLTFATANAVLGLVDLLGKATGVGDLLSPLRTASYQMLIDVQVEGFWRIVGGYPEASSFGGASVVALAFAFSYWRATGSRSVLALWSVLLLLLLMSTSTTGYAGLAVLVAFLATSALWRLLMGSLSRREVALLGVAGVGVATVLGILLFGNGWLDPAVRLIETTLLEKSASASASERFYWNQKSWMAFLDTYGLGVGLGSSRASSSFVAILSQLGVAGAVLFSLIYIEFFRRPVQAPAEAADGELVALCRALRSAGVAMIVVGAVSSGGADPGIPFFVALAGLIVGRARLSGAAARMRPGEDGAYLPHRTRQVARANWAGGFAQGHAPGGHAPAYLTAAGAPTQLNESDWAAVLAVFRACLPRRGGKAEDDRKFLEAMLYFAVHGISWRALPEEFGNWNSIWKRYWRLSRGGVFEDFFDSLAAARRTAPLAHVFRTALVRAGAPSRGAGHASD